MLIELYRKPLMKIILCTLPVVWVTLSFIFLPGSCPADSLPYSPQGETATVLLQGPNTIALLYADPSHPENELGPPVASFDPTCLSPASSSETKAIVLWQAEELSVLAESEPASKPSQSEPSKAEESLDTDAEGLAVNEGIPDPLEPVNRAFFQFNDKLYFWVLKPVATAYKAVLPEDLRVCFRNFFSNLKAPVRVANSLLQGEFKGAGNETARFGINTTLGFFGFFDQGKDKFDIDVQDRDLGQTFGIWGLGPAFYLNWPFLGPSSLRDTAGYIGDIFLDPRTYVLSRPVSIGLTSAEIVNDTSLRIGDYEAMKKAALDPYVSVKDGYHQYRQNKIKKK